MTRPLSLALPMMLAGCLSGADEADVASQTPQPIADDVIAVPVVFHFVYDGDDTGGVPSHLINGTGPYRNNAQGLDGFLNSLNSAVSATGARVQFTRAAVRFVFDDPSVPCAQLTAVPARYLSSGALNVVAAGRCAAQLPSASAAVIPWGTFSAMMQDVGSAFGLQRTNLNRDSLTLREPLARDTNFANAASCYRTGDALCDTPPNYGLFREGYTPAGQCPDALRTGADPFYCEQLGAACNPLDTVVDRCACVAAANGRGRRWYNFECFNNTTGSTTNIMSDRVRGGLVTAEQRQRMRLLARWRMNLALGATADQQRLLHNVPVTPTPESWQSLGASRAVRLAWARQTINFAPYETPYAPLTVAPTTRNVTVPAATGRILDVKLHVYGEFAMYPTTRITLTTPWGAQVTVPFRAARRPAGSDITTFDEAVTSEPSFVEAMRGFRPGGLWRVRIEDAANYTTPGIVALQVLSAPPNFNGDRDGRGASDVMVFRPGAGLITSRNRRPAQQDFAPGELTAIGVVSFNSMHAGDIDGDGAADLVMFNKDGRVRVTFSRENHALWRISRVGASTSFGASSRPFVVGDFDGDGLGDLLVSQGASLGLPGQWVYYRSQGNGDFDGGVAISFASTFTAVAADGQYLAGDVTGDGLTDLVVRDRATDRTYLARNVTAPGGAVRFAAPTSVYVGGSLTTAYDADELRLLDVDADGRDDLAVRRRGTGVWSYHRQVNPVTFGAGLLMTFNGDSVAYNDDDALLP